MMHKPTKRGMIRRHPHIKPMFAGLRHHDRKKANLHVTIIDEDGWAIPFESADISPSGVFIASDYLYEAGRVHDLLVRDQHGHTTRIKGQIVRVEGGAPSSASRAGMAYKFLSTDQRTFQSLSQLVASL